ncbi:hypothetical protein KNP65_09820 [Latilactobacillus curvatus]|uniref:hypothetical protein n=1 Tax=Latilactobacillus curvatus TaxID=28038 RepID=UPI0024115687|nr:hypothetical protein [Latilactobacillus curvatus]MDG2980241.1 hypothetical protein [Latilactobacillus curvatus]
MSVENNDGGPKFIVLELGGDLGENKLDSILRCLAMLTKFDTITKDKVFFHQPFYDKPIVDYTLLMEHVGGFSSSEYPDPGTLTDEDLNMGTSDDGVQEVPLPLRKKFLTSFPGAENIYADLAIYRDDAIVPNITGTTYAAGFVSDKINKLLE